MRTHSASLSKVVGVVALGLLAACGGGGGAPGTGTLQVRMRDTPVDAAERVFVTIARVEVFRSDANGQARETLVDTPAQYDLLELQHGVEAVLGTAKFPVGDYSSIRLVIAPDSRHEIDSQPADTLNNYIVIDGVAYPLIVPSGPQTGIKLNHHFTLSADQITVLTFDFDVRRSVHQRGHQGVFNLRPTLRLIDTVVSGTVSGTVTTSDASTLPAGTIVSAQQAGAEVASTAVDTTTGTYLLGPLLAGTYDLVVIAPGYGFVSESGVGVLAQQDSAGHDFVLTPAGVGDVAGTIAFTTTLPDEVTVDLLWSGFVVAATGIDDVTGAYAFVGVPAGSYTVRASDGTADVSGPATVTTGAATTVDLTLP
jgi:hypothetical protein